MIATKTGFNPDYSAAAPSVAQISGLSGTAILEFGTPWCGHCQAARPAIEAVLSTADLPHIKVEDGKGKPLGRYFGVKHWPTLVLLRDGAEIARLVRPVHAEEIQQLLAQTG